MSKCGIAIIHAGNKDWKAATRIWGEYLCGWQESLEVKV